MNKVLLVDDELLVRVHLKTLVDWQELGFTLCGEAANGEQALELIKQTKPDLVITDMTMPVMNGLELIRSVREQYPQCLIIVLSNYDDFPYVKESFQRGVFDYILKHKLTPEALREILLRARETLGQSDCKAEEATLSNDNLSAMRGRFLRRLITDFYDNPEELRAQISLLDLPLSQGGAVAVAMLIDNYHQICQAGMQAAMLMEIALLNIIEEILARNGSVCCVEKEKYALILTFPDVHSMAVIESTVDGLLNQISGCVQKFLNISVSFSVGPFCETLTQVAKSYQKASQKFSQRFYAGSNCLLHWNGQEAPRQFSADFLPEVEKTIRIQLHEMDFAPIQQELENCFDKIGEAQPEYSVLQTIGYSFASLLVHTANEHGIQYSAIFENDQHPYELLARIETLQAMKEFFLSAFRKLHLLLHPNREFERYSPAIQKAVLYIQQNYSHDISLEETAALSNLSKVYFCKLFKKETGVGFSEFVCSLRIEKAKLLLSGDDINLKWIAKQCGFNNYAYFFNVFKHNTGKTPSEYAQRIGGK